jgi:hypothetical protein
MTPMIGRFDRNTRAVAPARGWRVAWSRWFVAAAAAATLAACSSLKLGYDNADTLLLSSLDSYFDLDRPQQTLAGERVRALLQWHRATQLARYAQWLEQAQRRLDGRVTADDIATLNRQMNDKLVAIGEQAAPDLAALALTLTPAQIDRFAHKMAQDSSKARHELVHFDGARETSEHRIKRYTERADTWFGSVNPEQQEVIRAAITARSTTETWWMDERDRRQHEMVQLLRWVHTEKPPPAEAATRFRTYFAQLVEPADAARRAALLQFRQSNAELIARLVNAATPAQRAALAKKLRGYAEDFTALARAGGARG